QRDQGIRTTLSTSSKSSTYNAMKEAENTNWSSASWKGSRIENLRQWRQLSLNERFDAAEEIEVLAMHFLESRRKKGLPYFDPDSGELINPKPNSA
ncbi:MAG: hypothetical protein AAGJ79_08200, partial [Verrucomicrobiota bacterium]